MHLGGNNNTTGNHHLSTDNITVSFAPPKLTASNTSSTAVTVGLIQDLSMAQQRQITKYFEYGNDEYQMVTGKTRTQLTMNRVLFDGPSLLKYIGYARLDKDRLDHLINWGYQNMVGETEDSENGLSKFVRREKTRDSRMPGGRDFWVNLTSDLFDLPLGIFLNAKQRMPNGDLVDYGAVFLENCLVASYNLQMSPQNKILTENIQIEVGRPVPLKMTGSEDILTIESKLKGDFNAN